MEFEVEADRPVNTYVVDREGLEQFSHGRPEFPAYGGFARRKRHFQEVRLPFRGPWYLIVLNPSDKPATVHYQVRY